MRRIKPKSRTIVAKHRRVVAPLHATEVTEHVRETGGRLEEWGDKERRIRTKITKTVVPRPIRNALAGWYLFGRSTIVHHRGFHSTAAKMRTKAWQWAKGNRKEPDPNGQWSATRGPSSLRYKKSRGL